MRTASIWKVWGFLDEHEKLSETLAAAGAKTFLPRWVPNVVKLEIILHRTDKNRKKKKICFHFRHLFGLLCK